MPWLSRPCIGLAPGANGSPVPAPVGRVPRCLPVHHVRRDGQDRLGVHGIPVGRILPELGHEGADHPGRDLVHPIVVVAEQRELALGLVVRDEPGLVANHLHLRVLDGGKAVGHHREPGHAERHRPERRMVVQGHLDPLVGVLVVHVVDDVHRADVHARQPVHHRLEPGRHVIELEVVARAPARMPGPPGHR